MKKRDLIFTAICIVVVGGLIILSWYGKKAQPTDLTKPQHQGIKDLTPRTKCLECHDPQTGTIDVSKRIQKTHPEKWKDEKFYCQKCHALQPAP